MKNLLIICGLLFVFSSCYNDKADKLYVQPTTTTCDTSGGITFSGTVNPIIQANCGTTNTGCHSAGASSGYDYSTYPGIYRNAVSGLLLPAIQHTGSGQYMPLNASQLSSCDIEKIAAWINEGAQNN
jgi:hypothetical protein